MSSRQVPARHLRERSRQKRDFEAPFKAEPDGFVQNVIVVFALKETGLPQITARTCAIRELPVRPASLATP